MFSSRDKSFLTDFAFYIFSDLFFFSAHTKSQMIHLAQKFDSQDQNERVFVSAVILSLFL